MRQPAAPDAPFADPLDQPADPPDQLADEPDERLTRADAPTARARRTGERPPTFPMGRQLDVMSVLWAHRSGTVAQVMARLNDIWEPEIAYTTTLTYLRTLRRRGWVTAEREDKADRYYPATPIGHVRRLALDYLTERLFTGSREALLEYLVADELTSRHTLERLAPALRAALERPPREPRRPAPPRVG